MFPLPWNGAVHRTTIPAPPRIPKAAGRVRTIDPCRFPNPDGESRTRRALRGKETPPFPGAFGPRRVRRRTRRTRSRTGPRRRPGRRSVSGAAGETGTRRRTTGATGPPARCDRFPVRGSGERRRAHRPAPAMRPSTPVTGPRPTGPEDPPAPAPRPEGLTRAPPRRTRGPIDGPRGLEGACAAVPHLPPPTRTCAKRLLRLRRSFPAKEDL